MQLALFFAAINANPTLVITNARIADGSGGAIVAGKVVVVAGDTIVKITDQKKWKTPAGVREIDGTRIRSVAGVLLIRTTTPTATF